MAPRGAVLEGVRGTRMDGEIGRIRGRCLRGSGATRARTEEGGVEEEEVEVAVAVMEAARHALLPLPPRRRSVCFYDRRPQSLRHLRGRTRSWPLQQRRARRRIPRMLNRCCAVSSRPRLLGSSWRGGLRRSRPMETEARRMERPSRLLPPRHPPRRRRRRRAPQTAAAQPPQRIRPPSISGAPPSMAAPSPPPRRQSFWSRCLPLLRATWICHWRRSRGRTRRQGRGSLGLWRRARRRRTAAVIVEEQARVIRTQRRDRRRTLRPPRLARRSLRRARTRVITARRLYPLARR